MANHIRDLTKLVSSRHKCREDFPKWKQLNRVEIEAVKPLEFEGVGDKLGDDYPMKIQQPCGFR